METFQFFGLQFLQAYDFAYNLCFHEHCYNLVPDSGLWRWWKPVLSKQKFLFDRLIGSSHHIIYWAPVLFCNIRYGITLFQVMLHLLMCSETFQIWHQEILTDWKGTLTPKTQTGKQNYDNKGYAWQLLLHTSYQQTIEGSRHQDSFQAMWSASGVIK